MLILYQLIALTVGFRKTNDGVIRLKRLSSLYFLFAMTLLWCFPIIYHDFIPINFAGVFYFVISYIFIFFSSRVYYRSVKYALSAIILLLWSNVFRYTQFDFYAQISFVALLISINVIMFDKKSDVFINSAFSPIFCFYSGIAFDFSVGFEFSNMIHIMLIALIVSDFIIDLAYDKPSNSFTYKELYTIL